MTGDVENVLAADKRRALVRLQELEDEARTAAEKERKASALSGDAVQFQLGRADAFALARDVVSGRAF